LINFINLFTRFLSIILVVSPLGLKALPTIAPLAYFICSETLSIFKPAPIIKGKSFNISLNFIILSKGVDLPVPTKDLIQAICSSNVSSLKYIFY